MLSIRPGDGRKCLVHSLRRRSGGEEKAGALHGGKTDLRRIAAALLRKSSVAAVVITTLGMLIIGAIADANAPSPRVPALRARVSLPAGLTPGTSGAIRLEVFNPSKVAQQLSTVHFSPLSLGRRGCARAWFVVSDGLSLPVRVPAHGTVDLLAGSLSFHNARIDQDACRDARLRLALRLG